METTLDQPEVLESSPADVSMEAALQLEELKQGRRPDAPALHSLFDLLRKPSQGFSGEGISMLADLRAFTIFKESLGQVWPKVKMPDHDKLTQFFGEFLAELERGVADRDKHKIEQAKQFCLAFNTSLLAKHMSDIFARRERSDARYISHESVS
jgi:hypothetical protein